MPYILITDPEDETVRQLHEAELAEYYTRSEITALKEGRVIFKNGALHADMVIAARAVTTEELING